ncbi:MAG: ribosome-binding factor A [Lentisphaeria bacterium]
MATDRLRRVNVLLQRELSMLFERLIRPELKGVLVTVTSVEITTTLRDARVYVSILRGNNSGLTEDAVMALLQRKRAALQKAVANHVVLKYTPVLHFKQDKTAERAEHVMDILHELDIPEEDTPEDDI